MIKEKIDVQHWLAQYIEAYDKLCQYFGCDIVSPPEMMLDLYWGMNSTAQSLYYDNHERNDIESMAYCYDIRRVWEQELYTLVFVQDTFGDKFMTVWSNARRINNKN